MRRRLLLAAFLAFGLAGAHAPAQAQEDITKAQPVLPKEKITINTHDGRHLVFDVEVARTLEQQTVGLMFRTSVPPDGGMLFDWGAAKPSQMWMRNTLVPLDMVFIDGDGTIRSIAENTVPHSLAVIDSGGPVRATLELAAGTTQRLDIRVGDKVTGGPFGS